MAGNRIDPRAIIVGDVEFGDGNIVEAGAVIVGPTVIGDGNYFGLHCVIGAPPQHDGAAEALRVSGLLAESGGLLIGDGNVMREYVAVHRGFTGTTQIGDGCYLMAYTNVQHDCVVGDRVKLANNVQMGGYSWIGRGSYLGLSAVIHQFTVIGAYSMVGMGSVVTRREVPLGSVVFGSPAQLVRPNHIALAPLGVGTRDWWDDLASESASERIPDELADDFAEFRAACSATAEARRAATEWNNGQRSRARGS